MAIAACVGMWLIQNGSEPLTPPRAVRRRGLRRQPDATRTPPPPPAAVRAGPAAHPGIGVDAPVIRLGLDRDGSLEVPPRRNAQPRRLVPGRHHPGRQGHRHRRRARRRLRRARRLLQPGRAERGAPRSRSRARTAAPPCSRSTRSRSTSRDLPRHEKVYGPGPGRAAGDHLRRRILDRGRATGATWWRSPTSSGTASTAELPRPALPTRPLAATGRSRASPPASTRPPAAPRGRSRCPS